MFLSKLFKHTRAKVLAALVGLTMAFGTAATFSTVAATQQNEVVETKAAVDSSSRRIYFKDYSSNKWFQGDAKVWAHSWGSENQDTLLTSAGKTDYYYVDIATGNTSIIFVRGSKTSSGPGDWGKIWTQTGNLSIDKNCYTLTGHDGGPGNWNYYHPESTGWYLVGDATFCAAADVSSGVTWDPSAGLKMSGGTPSATVTFTGTGATFKAVNVTSSTADLTWSQASPTLNANYTTVDDSGNIVIAKAGTYTFEVDTSTSPKYIYVKYIDDVKVHLMFSGLEFKYWYSSNGSDYVLKYIPVGTPVSNMYSGAGSTVFEAPTPYGYTFNGYYSDSSMTTTVDKITASVSDLYLNYEPEETAHHFYILVPTDAHSGLFSINDWETTTYIYVWKNNGATVLDIPCKTLFNNGSDKLALFSFYIPADAQGFIVHRDHNNLDNANTMTVDLSIASAGDNNLYAVGGFNGSKHNGEWCTMAFYLQQAADNTFDPVSKQTLMSDPQDKTNTDIATVYEVAISASTYVRIACVIPNASTQYFATLDSEGGAGVAAQSGGVILVSTAGTYKVRLDAMQKVFFSSTSAALNRGYLYIPSNSLPSSITFSAKVNGNTPTYGSAKLSKLEGIETSSTLTWTASKPTLIRFPVYSLIGSLSPSGTYTSYSITIGGYTATINNAVNSPSYYWEGTSTATLSANTDAAKAVYAAWLFDSTINGNDRKSICYASKGEIKDLIGAYEDVEDVDTKTTLDAAKINTWNGASYHKGDATEGGPSSDQDASYTIEEIYDYISTGYDTVNGTWRIGALIPGAPTGNESPLTMTLWIVLGCGVAGLGAIGAAYFVSKKKKRPEA